MRHQNKVAAALTVLSGLVFGLPLAHAGGDPARGFWVAMDSGKPSLFDGSKPVGTLLPSSEGAGTMLLGVTCMEGNLSLYLRAPQVTADLPASARTLGTATIRFDAEPAVSERWVHVATGAIPIGHLPFDEREANEHTIFLVRELTHHRKLALRLSMGGRMSEDWFDLTGSSEVLKPILDACGL